MFELASKTRQRECCIGDGQGECSKWTDCYEHVMNMHPEYVDSLICGKYDVNMHLLCLTQ